jgi:DNA-binding LacI/PurR family transcriptional regulator
MQDLLRQQQPMPDAIFCANDLLAIGPLRTLADHAIDVLGQIAVIGVDDIEDAGYTVPSLSTIASDKGGIVRLGVQCLIARIDAEPGADHRPADLTVLFEVKIRQST